MPPRKKITQTQEITQIIDSNAIIKEKKPRKSTKKVDISVKTEILENKEVEEVKEVKVNSGKKIMKNELLKEIETHKHLNEDARVFLISFFKNYKEDFIYEENYNQLINNIIGAQENKNKILHYLNELNKRREIINEHKNNKYRFYKKKASQPILSGSQKQYFIHHSYKQNEAESQHHNPLFKNLAIKEAELQANKVIQELEENIDVMELLQNNQVNEEDSDQVNEEDSDENKRGHFLTHDEILHFLVKNNDSSESILNSDNNNHNNIMNFSQLPTVQEKKAIFNCALQIENDDNTKDTTCLTPRKGAASSRESSIMRFVEEESVKNASINDILSLYLYKVYLEKEKEEKEKEKINHNEHNMKSILPNDNKSEYFYSYFVIELNNKVVKLAPYVVKIDKYLNFKNKIFENSGFIKYRNRFELPENNHIELDKNLIKSVNERSDYTANEDFLISAFLTHFRNQYIHFSKRVDNEKLNVLFNDVSLYESIMNNSILDLIQFEKSENKDYILNNFLKLFDMIDDDQIYFNMIDIGYVQQFYNFYLELYGEKNIKSIHFLWDYNKDTLAHLDKSENKENNVKNMLCVVNPSVKNVRKDCDFKNSLIGFHNLEKYLFDENEIQYVKDMFPYKLENCLSYSFSNHKNMDSILALFDISYDSRIKKTNIISMMGDKEEEQNNKPIEENDLWAIFNNSFFEKYGSYLHHNFLYKLQNKHESIFGPKVVNKFLPKRDNTNYINTIEKQKNEYNDNLSNIIDFDINDFDKEHFINNLHFLQIFTLEQFKFYIQSIKKSFLVNDLYNKYLSKDILDNDDFIQLLYTIVQKIDIDYIKREHNIYLLVIHLLKTFILEEEIHHTTENVKEVNNIILQLNTNEQSEKRNIHKDIKNICNYMKSSKNEGTSGLIQLTNDESVNNILLELNNGNSTLPAESFKDIYMNHGTNYCAYSNTPQNIVNKYSYIEEKPDPMLFITATKELLFNIKREYSPVSHHFDDETREKMKREKDGLKKTIFIFYHKVNKNCNVFQYELSQDISNILNKTIYDYFDIFYGNEFVFIEALKEDSIDVEFVNIYNDFNGKYFLNRNEVNEYYKLISKRYKKEVVIQKSEVVLSVEEYCKIIRKYYNIDTNVDNRIRSTELSTKLIDIINQDIENKHQYINEDHFISKFSEIVSELGLSKKRYASGNYYYGISQKVIGNNNILKLLNVEKIPDGIENYDNDILNVISKMESELNALKNKFKNKPEKEKETIYSKNNEIKLLSNNESEKIHLNKGYFLPRKINPNVIIKPINPNSIVKPFC